MADAHRYPVEFERGLRAHEVRLPRCASCGRYHWYPLKRCPHCLSVDVGWQAPAGVPTIFTCSTVSHAFHPDWSAAVPYTVALVTYDDTPGIRLVAQIVGPHPDQVEIGTVVEPVFLEEGEGMRLAFRAKDSSRIE